MKRLLFLFALVLVTAACGEETTGGQAPSTSVPPTTSTVVSTLPGATQRELLEAARTTWAAKRPETYRFTFALACECDQGPWTLTVDGDLLVDVSRDGPGIPGAEVPFESIDAIFDDIEATLDEGTVPVDVEYDPELGYPTSYVWNGPELPVDGGFILTVTEFAGNPDTGDPALLADLAAAEDRWEAAGLADYDYNFTRGCFCPEEFVGPFRASVRAGEVSKASFNGTDLFEIDILEIGRYDEIVRTVPGVFGEIKRAIREADRLDVEYHPVLGYPTEVFIDWEFNMADEEVSYRIETLRAPLPILDSCSTSSVTLDLIPQPGLPATVADTRSAIYQAAMACDIATLDELTSGAGFTASFGGGNAGEHWLALEEEGRPVLLAMVQHLNQAYTAFGDGGDVVGYTWPSAFLELESPDGTGLPADEYEALLELYSVDDLTEMFEVIGGYVGYRHGIEPDGTWIYFVAGD